MLGLARGNKKRAAIFRIDQAWRNGVIRLRELDRTDLC